MKFVACSLTAARKCVCIRRLAGVHPSPRSTSPNRSCSSLPSAPVLHELGVEHHEFLAQDNAVGRVVVAVVSVDLAEEFRWIVPVPLPEVKPAIPTRATAPTRAGSDERDPLLARLSLSRNAASRGSQSSTPLQVYGSKGKHQGARNHAHAHKNLKGV